MSDLFVVYGNGAQALSVVLYETDGRPAIPSSATYSIIDLRHLDSDTERTVQASTAATVSSISQALTAVAGPGASDRTRIDVASTAGISAGDQLLLQDANGRSELVEVDAVDSSNGYVYTRDPILGAYPATDSTLLGIQVSGTFPAAEADDEDEVEDQGGPYALDIVASGMSKADHRFIVWLRRTEERQYATLRDVRRLDQTLQYASHKTSDLHRCLDQAHRDLNSDLRMAGIDPSRYHGGPVATDAVTYRAAYHARRHLRTPTDEAWAETYDDRYQGLVASITQGSLPQSTVVTRVLDDVAEPGSSRDIFDLFEPA